MSMCSFSFRVSAALNTRQLVRVDHRRPVLDHLEEPHGLPLQLGVQLDDLVGPMAMM
jgi:hypothetical protein